MQPDGGREGGAASRGVARPSVRRVGGGAMVDLGGYVIILVETKEKKVKLYGE